MSLGSGRYPVTRWVSFVLGTPIRFTDPSGHSPKVQEAIWAPNYGPSQQRRTIIDTCNTVERCKEKIQNRYNITIGTGWDNELKNLQILFAALQILDAALVEGGGLKKYIGKNIVTLNFVRNPLLDKYEGKVVGTTMTFNMPAGGGKLSYHNIYHEFGHLLDYLAGNAYSNALAQAPDNVRDDNKTITRKNPLTKEKEIATIRVPWESEAFKKDSVTDPEGTRTSAYQNLEVSAREEWADLFANYVSENIDLDEDTGRARYSFVRLWLFGPTGSR